MSAYFARMCFAAGAFIGIWVGGLAERFDWPTLPSAGAGLGIYIGGSIVIEALGRRIQRKAEQAPVASGRSEP